jgi:signal transduction histidine kinase
MPGTQSNKVCLACMTASSATAALVEETVAALIPGCVVTCVDSSVERSVPTADCIVVDASVGGESGLTVLRNLRARGYCGATVLLVESRDAADERSAAQIGAVRFVLKCDLVGQLPSAIVDALRLNSGGTESARLGAALCALREAQQLIAAGELALRLQHSLNNPLAALLAEAQLLELEELPAEHRLSVERIVEMCRRTVEIVRQLDGVGTACKQGV